MLEKRGQAALEFLMTYGWAILAAIIVIGVLAYFGVFSPGKYAPKVITINAPFGVTQEYSVATDSINFVLRNGAGDSVNISSIAIAGCGTNSTAMTMADGTSKLITVPCSPVLTSSDKFKGAITITYRTGEQLIDLTSTGDISGTVA